MREVVQPARRWRGTERPKAAEDDAWAAGEDEQ
jgi:hypothetical protein